MKIKFIHIITANLCLIFNFSCQEEDFEFGAIKFQLILKYPMKLLE